MRDLDVMVVGAGRLGGAVVRGLSKAGLGRERIHIVERPGPTLAAWEAEGFRVTTELPGGARPGMILVAVKPAALAGVIDRLLASDGSGVPVVSLASGMTLREWKAALGARFPVLRARANVLVATGRGNVLLARSDVAPDVDAAVARVLGLLGAVSRVSEEEMVAATWYSSTLPIVLVGRLLLDSLSAASAGPQRELAERLVLEGVLGVAEQLAAAAGEAEARGEVLATSDALRGLMEQVVTPGGMNAAALEALERGGFSALVEAARIVYQSKERGGGAGATATEER